MIVLCVNNEAWPDNVKRHDNDSIIENGRTYRVIDVFFDEGCIWYELAEDPDFGYWENCFARTSDILETDFVRNYQKELA